MIDPDGQQVDIINFGVNLYSSILEGQEQNKITSKMSSEEKAEYYGMSMDEYSRGNVEATGDEMIIGDLAIVGAKVGLFATLKGFGRLATEESGSVLSKELVKTGKQFTTHASEQIGDAI
ncbi:MAG: hypothetical protein IPL53_23805 [Ignavibacteria bacterium]|nr:hypothetical protein [Ignavibacteria bacterium]